jgi:hypothetical protein
MQNAEVSKAVATAQERQLPLYILNGSGSYYVAELLRQGFTTRDPAWNDHRVFTRSGSHPVVLVRPSSSAIGVLEAPEGLSAPSQAVVVGESSTLRAWYLQVPTALERIGAVTAIFTTEPRS